MVCGVGFGCFGRWVLLSSLLECCCYLPPFPTLRSPDFLGYLPDAGSETDLGLSFTEKLVENGVLLASPSLYSLFLGSGREIRLRRALGHWTGLSWTVWSASMSDWSVFGARPRFGWKEVSEVGLGGAVVVGFWTV